VRNDDLENQNSGRRSVRLPGRDYGQAGAYFVTIVTRDRAPLFGAISTGEMQPNALGDLVVREWLRTVQIRPRISADTFVVMPNHLHGILIIADNAGTVPGRGTLQRDPTVVAAEGFGQPTHDTLPTIVRGFKATTARQINLLRGTPGQPVWQRGYLEHVIRHEAELTRVRGHIAGNPGRWVLDHENPEARCR
jgi:putative transposase